MPRWKEAARALRKERDALRAESTKQKRLLLWMLDQVTAEAAAAQELDKSWGDEAKSGTFIVGKQRRVVN